MNHSEFIDDFVNMINRYNSLEQLDITFIPRVKISHADVHLLDVMWKNPYKKASQLAEIFGVTKGAVSQQIKKLVKRDLINRVQYDDNCKEVFIELTDLGKEAVNNHKKIDMEVLESLNNILSETTDDQKTFLHNIIKSLGNGFDKAEKTLGKK